MPNLNSLVQNALRNYSEIRKRPSPFLKERQEEREIEIWTLLRENALNVDSKTIPGMANQTRGYILSYCLANFPMHVFEFEGETIYTKSAFDFVPRINYFLNVLNYSVGKEIKTFFNENLIKNGNICVFGKKHFAFVTSKNADFYERKFEVVIKSKEAEPKEGRIEINRQIFTIESDTNLSQVSTYTSNGSIWTGDFQNPVYNQERTNDKFKVVIGDSVELII